jgi:hypothetical protein
MTSPPPAPSREEWPWPDQDADLAAELDALLAVRSGAAAWSAFWPYTCGYVSPTASARPEESVTVSVTLRHRLAQVSGLFHQGSRPRLPVVRKLPAVLPDQPAQPGREQGPGSQRSCRIAATATQPDAAVPPRIVTGPASQPQSRSLA